MPSDEFENHLRNTKYFLRKRNLDSRSDLCNIQQPNFHKSRSKWYVVCPAPCTGCEKYLLTLKMTFQVFLLVNFSFKDLV